MKHLKFTFALAAILFAFTGCQKDNVTIVENTVTHRVSFITGAPQTRTTATPDGDVVNYAWTSADENRFTVYEKVGDTYTPANETIGILDEGTGKMSLMAEFAGEAPAEAQYQALFNSGVQSIQFGTQTEYDQNSDVLASLPVDASTADAEALNLQFMRMSSISRATLKQLTIDEASLPSGSVIKSVSVETIGDGATDLAAGYSIEDGCFAEGGKRIEIRNADITVASDAANVFFASVPAYNKYVRMAATAYSSTGEFLTAYEKTFTKTISFEKGDMYYFGVKMEEVKSQTFDLSVAPEISTADSLVWRTGLMKIVSRKSGSSTAANNYCPPAKTSTRFYKDFLLTFLPLSGASVESIEIKAGSDSYAAALAGASWLNAQVSSSGSTVTVVPVSGTDPVTATLSGTSGVTSIDVTYGVPVVPGSHSITISDSIENGTVESDYSMALAGTEIHLTATPASGYVFGQWTVTNVSTSEAITVTDDSFVMPDADVLVSATFIKDYGIRRVSVNIGNTGLTSSYATKTFEIDGITFGCTNWMKSTNIQAKSGTANSLYNVTEFEHLRRIRIVLSAAAGFEMYAGTTEQPTTLIETKPAATVMEFDLFDSNSKYFSIKPLATGHIDTVLVEYGLTPVLESVAVSGTLGKKTYAEGDTLKADGLVATAVYQDGTRRDVSSKVVWTKSPSGALASGTTSASFVATYKGVSSSAYVVNDITVVAPIHVSSVSLNVNSAEMCVGGDDVTLVATVTPSDATNKAIIWSSSNSSVATVANGVVSAVSLGSAVITATSEDGGKTANCSVTVRPFTTSEAISFIDTATSSELARSVYVAGTVSKVDSYNSTYHSITYWLDSNTFEVYSGRGLDNTDFSDINGVKTGSDVVIYGVVKKYSTTYEFDKNNYLVSYLPPIDFSISDTTVAKNTVIIPTITGSVPGSVVTYESDNTSIVAVSDGGTTLTSGSTTGSVTITATMTAPGYKATSKTFAVTVTSGAVLSSITIGGSLTKSVYTVGESFSFSGLTATGIYSDETQADITASVDWTVSPSTLTSATTSVTVTATSGDVHGSKAYGVTVNKKASSILVSDVSVSVGDSKTVSATTTPSGAALSLSTVSGTGSVTISGMQITGETEGTVTLKASYAGNDEYAATETTFTVTVTGAAKTAVYTQTSSSAVSATGDVPAGAGATFGNTYTSNKAQLTNGNSMTLTLTGYTGKKIVGLTLSMKSNSKSGAGYLSFKARTSGGVETTIASIGSSSSPLGFNDSKWYGSWWSQDYVNVDVALSDADHLIAEGETLTIIISATANSLYCQRFEVKYID